MTKRFLVVLAGLLILNLQASAQAAGDSAGAADVAWQQLDALKRVPYVAIDTEAVRLIKQERAARAYRDAGVMFWETYPNDARRYQWLVETTMTEPFPFYWRDPEQGVQRYIANNRVPAEQRQPIEIDAPTRALWKRRYWQDFRPALLAAAQAAAPRQLRERLLVADIRMKAMESEEYWLQGKPVDLEGYADLIVEHSSYAEEDMGRGYTMPLFMYVRLANAGAARERGVIDRLLRTSHPQLRALAEGKRRELDFRSHPIDISLPMFGGTTLDLRSLRGKVMLADVWSLSCSSCIEALPRVRELYDRYHAQGFEVVGVFLTETDDHEKEIAKARRVLKETGADAWPTALLVGDTGKQFMRNYGIQGFPVTWLFDQQGLLVSNAFFKKEQMSAEVNRLLGIGK